MAQPGGNWSGLAHGMGRGHRGLKNPGGSPGRGRPGVSPQEGDGNSVAWGELSGRPAVPLPRAPRHKPRSDPRGECPESCGCHPRLFFFFFSGPLGSLISLSCHPFQSLPPCYLPWPWPFLLQFSVFSPTPVWLGCPSASVGAHAIPRVHLQRVRTPEQSWGLCGPF